MAPLGTLHYIEATAYKADKALVAAKFSGIEVTQKKFDAEKDAKKPEFLAKNPTGKVPYLETDMGCVFTSNAVARYIARCRADTTLYGKSFNDEAQIDTWMEFCTHEVEVPLMTWVYPTMGLLEDIPNVTADAQKDVKKALGVLEESLKKSAFLVGDFVSLADIVLVCALREGFARVLDAAFRKPFPKVSAWFEKCTALPQFVSVLGKVTLCTQAQKPIPVKAAPAKKAADAKPANKEAKKAASPKASPKAAPAAKPAAAAGGGAATEAQVTAVGDQIRVLKEKLKAEGLSGKKINDHEEVKGLVAKLQELKTNLGAAPAAAAAAKPASPKAKPASPKAKAAAAPAAGGDVDAQVTAVGDQIRVLKEKLKGEGLSGKKINDHEEVKSLVAKLQELKSQAGAAPAAAAKPASPKAKAASPKAKAAAAPAAAAAGGDVEAQVKAVGDEIRVLKEKLKGEGITGKKLNDHDEVKSLVTRLAALKAQM